MRALSGKEGEATLFFRGEIKGQPELPLSEHRILPGYGFSLC